VEDDKIERILRAGMEAPSAHNRRPWEFIVITDKADLEAVAAMSPYAKMVPSAAALIAVCARPGPERTAEDWWIQDLSAATENILLQIVEEGLGGVWLGWYPNEERVAAFSRHFGLPEDVLPFSMVALGYPEGQPKSAERFDPKRIHYGRYGNQKKI
jgi:nitroreductase